METLNKKKWYGTNKAAKELVSDINRGIDYIYENCGNDWWRYYLSLRVYANGYEIYTNTPGMGYLPAYIGSNVDSQDELGNFVGSHPINPHEKWKSGKHGVEDCKILLEQIFDLYEACMRRDGKWIEE